MANILQECEVLDFFVDFNYCANPIPIFFSTSKSWILKQIRALLDFENKDTLIKLSVNTYYPNNGLFSSSAELNKCWHLVNKANQTFLLTLAGHLLEKIL